MLKECLTESLTRVNGRIRIGHSYQEGYCVNWRVMFCVVSQIGCVLNFSILGMFTLWTFLCFFFFLIQDVSHLGILLLLLGSTFSLCW